MTPTATRTPDRGVDVSAQVSDATAALDLRARKHRRRFALTVLIPLLVLVLVAAGVYLFGFSRVFALTSVQVRGTDTLTRAEVIQSAQVPLGAPMATVDLKAITARVDGIRGVESAQVTRSWPSSMTITVHERQPVFAIAGEGTYLLVDRFGVGYRLSDTRPAGQVLASVDSQDQPLLVQVAAVVAALPNSVRNQLESVQASTGDSITLRLTKSRVVFFGDDSRVQDKLQVLRALLKHPGSRYDVSAPDQPAIRR